MEVELLKRLLEDEKYQNMTVGAFVQTLKEEGMWEKKKEDDLDFLKSRWRPGEVIYHTNKDKS